jgi:hypothetical protein
MDVLTESIVLLMFFAVGKCVLRRCLSMEGGCILASRCLATITYKLMEVVYEVHLRDGLRCHGTMYTLLSFVDWVRLSEVNRRDSQTA